MLKNSVFKIFVFVPIPTYMTPPPTNRRYLRAKKISF
jgi:hypothetical protein